MNNIAEVKLWGRTIGAVAYSESYDNTNTNQTSERLVSSFEYDEDFRHSGIEVAPLMMPTNKRLYRFPELAKQTFQGLPGMLADSLPDKFGNALIDAWLATQGRSPASFNAIERLCYIGARGMGAFEFVPTTGPKLQKNYSVEIDQLVSLASDVLRDRETFNSSFETQDRQKALSDILRVGTSAGGARAKAIIAWNQDNNEIRSGQINAGEGFEYWMLKFDGVDANSDKELNDPQGYGAIEYAYYKMAIDAGIQMNECCLFEENNRKHFMTKRFDRLENGEKLHMQSLCAMAHFDFNMAGAYSYEQVFQCIRQLDLPIESHEQQFRRMVFNIVARNQDDHVKNIAFLMDKSGTWSLSPAYDLTYSYNPDGAWTSSHQMTVNGKRDHFNLNDLKACSQTALLKQGRAESIIKEVCNVVKNWKNYANEVGVKTEFRDQINKNLRTSLG